jgi:hypothetical protein
MARYICKVVVGKGVAKIECLDTVTGRRESREERWDWLGQKMIESLKNHPDFEVTILPEVEHE